MIENASMLTQFESRPGGGKIGEAQKSAPAGVGKLRSDVI